jgi:ADP-ribosyl-[dinitrogen reductase] hydrolase
MREDAIAGCLIGSAVGDALGLPREGLSPRRAARLFPDTDRFHFLFGHGMFSDDTEHACMTAQALLVAGGAPERFARSLAWRLRWWLLGLPFGTGKATFKACVKLWLGFSPSKSGVWSAGNGPAMRTPIIGVCFGNQPERLRALVRASTRLTHRDPKAEWGALAVAVAAHLAATPFPLPSPEETARTITAALLPEAVEFVELVHRAARSAAAGETTEAFAAGLGLARGVTGYMFHTVPVVLHAWLIFPDDYRSAVRAVIHCGGDTDSTAAIVGALVGARVGPEGIPAEWRKGLCEWPRDLRWMGRLARALAAGIAAGRPSRGVPLSFLGVLARNLFFDLTVLVHALRRLLPPY